MGDYILCHHGIRGMKWGVRRYQNKDGSLTPAGKKRADRDMADLSNKKKKNYEAKPDKWVKEDMERSKKLVDSSSQANREVQNAIDRHSSSPKKIKMDLSKMSDQQMRQEINRAMLERQYNELFAPQKTSRGKEYAKKTLNAVGTTLALTSSALGIALAVKELKG